MLQFHQKFTIHPVGQGLFYSCNINHDNQIKFRMVIDCGSNTAKACQDEVSLYKDSDYLKQKNLDLLVISHFDSDHVKYIGLLLQDNIKIKRLVMPFITFEERLFLVTRHLSHSNGFKEEDDFTIKFIIDPIGTINNSFDGDSEIYLIEGDPSSPIPPQNDDLQQFDDESNNQNRFSFDFDNSAKEKFDYVKITSSSSAISGKIYKVKDTNKGKVKGSFSNYKLMEFLFYKRSISETEGVFFKEVEVLFYEKFAISNSLSVNEKLEEVIKGVKGISSASPIKAIFKAAAKKVALKVKKGIKIDDLNTTALCLLHRNSQGIFDFLRINLKVNQLYHNPYYNIRQIQKFNGNFSRMEFIWPVSNRYYTFYKKRLDNGLFIYPNVLLTSDSFLLSEEQLSEFLSKFKHYWSDFWLFQIPHHGSNKSSDKLLQAHIPLFTYNFINYGVRNRDKHPSESVITGLVATGNSTRSIPVNEHVGLVFEYII